MHQCTPSLTLALELQGETVDEELHQKQIVVRHTLLRQLRLHQRPVKEEEWRSGPPYNTEGVLLVCNRKKRKTHSEVSILSGIAGKRKAGRGAQYWMLSNLTQRYFTLDPA